MKEENEIFGITCFFNPASYKNKYQNYLRFRKSSKKQGLKLLVVELSFGDKPFELRKSDAEILLRIKGNNSNILWQKERLLNIALQHLPKKCTKIIWVDSDILFKNNNWVSETSTALDKYDIIQPFEETVFLKKNIFDLEDKIIKKLPLGNSEMHKSKGLIFAMKTGGLISHEGHVWAAKKNIFQEIGFYDTTVISNADTLMGFAFMGKRDYKYLDSFLSKKGKEDYLLWQNLITKKVEGNVGFIEGKILHLWHGNKKNRIYGTLERILKKYDFDPKKDIYLDKNQLWAWTNNNLKLKKVITDYFVFRKEDNLNHLKNLKNSFSHFYDYHLIDFFAELERIVGKCGIFINKLSPKLYKKLKKIKRRTV